jgi:methylase of polypeptide subunit release factors
LRHGERVLEIGAASGWPAVLRRARRPRVATDVVPAAVETIRRQCARSTA